MQRTFEKPFLSENRWESASHLAQNDGAAGSASLARQREHRMAPGEGVFAVDSVESLQNKKTCQLYGIRLQITLIFDGAIPFWPCF